jgi:hypothetical protein
VSAYRLSKIKSKLPSYKGYNRLTSFVRKKVEAGNMVA